MIRLGLHYCVIRRKRREEGGGLRGKWDKKHVRAQFGRKGKIHQEREGEMRVGREKRGKEKKKKKKKKKEEEEEEEEEREGWEFWQKMNQKRKGTPNWVSR